MTARDILADLGAALDERRHYLAELDGYYAGAQPLTFLSPESSTALGDRLRRVSVNVPRLVVSSIVERLRVTGLHRDGVADPSLWAIWTGNDCDQTSGIAVREALTLGASYAMVWAGPRGPRISIESAHQVLVSRDPASREVTAAVKVWHDAPSRAGVPGPQHAVTYERDRLTFWATDSPGAPVLSGAWRQVSTLDNPLGQVPIVPLVNAERLLDCDGRSEFVDTIPLTDALVKLTTDMLVTSEYYARPRRWVSGLEVPVDGDGNPINPFTGDAERTWIAEPADARFGSFAATDLAAYDTAAKVILQQIMAVSGLPAHYVGVTTSNPASAEALKSAEAALVARAESKQAIFGRAFEQVMRLAVAVRDGVDPSTVDVSVQWADPATRSVAQEADAVTKLVAAGVLPADEALRRMGYSDADVTRIREQRRTAALDANAGQLAQMFSTPAAP